MFIVVRKTPNKRSKTLFYKVRDGNCIGCACFEPGEAEFKEDKRIFRKKPYHNFKKKPMMYKVCLNMISPSGCPEDTGYSNGLRDHRIQELKWDTTVI